MTRPPKDPTQYQPRLVEDGIVGSRCTTCRRAAAPATHRCPWCSATVEAATFGTRGTVWASTVVHLPMPDHPAPRALAYVDLADGPRVLVPQDTDEVWPIDTPVVLSPSPVAGEWARASREAQ